LLTSIAKKTVISTFADDTAIIAKDSDPTTASRNLQDHLTSIEKWLQKWRIKVNQNKSTHITFTNRKGQCPPISINQTTIPQGSTVKYLGLHLDSKLTGKEHITKKRKQLDLKTREINWLIGKNSPLSLENKLLIYKKGAKTHMDIRHSTLGPSQQIKYISNTVIPVKTPPYYNKCALVRNQPNTSLRPTHPVRPLRSARLYPQTSISTRSPFQPPHGTFTPHNTHQETEKTLDIWWDKMRCGQWTNTWSKDTTNSALAYTELCTVFSDC